MRRSAVHPAFKRGARGSVVAEDNTMFRKLILSIAALAALIFPIDLPASATLGVGGFAVRDSLAESSPVERAQFVWAGRNYCWYDSAWSGPGWYWCGYAWRRGFGWGGPVGWHGWRRPVHRTHVVHHHHRPVNRPGHHRPPAHRPPATRPPSNRPGGGNNRPGNRPGHSRPGASRPGNNRPGASRPGNNRPGHNRPSGGNRGGGNRGGGNRGGGQRRS